MTSMDFRLGSQREKYLPAGLRSQRKEYVDLLAENSEKNLKGALSAKRRSPHNSLPSPDCVLSLLSALEIPRQGDRVLYPGTILRV